MNLVFEDEGKGEPLVLFNGSMGSARQWDQVHIAIQFSNVWPGHAS